MVSRGSSSSKQQRCLCILLRPAFSLAVAAADCRLRQSPALGNQPLAQR